MTINLKKGEKIDLTKGRNGLSKITVGLGWDEAKPESSGGLFGFFKSVISQQDIDCDASVFLLDNNGKSSIKNNLVYFGNLGSSCGSISHQGDNLTGAGDGDDEVIKVNLSKIPSSIEKLSFVVNIYEATSRSQHFGMIKNAYIRILDDRTGEELVKFNLSEDYSGKKTLYVGEIFRKNNEWHFDAVGEGTTEDSLSRIKERYEIY
jgi:stress response protein SCP2